METSNNSNSANSKKTFLLAVASGLVIVAGIGYLVVSSISKGDALEYFKDVHQALENPGEWKDKRLRMRGNVIAGTIQKKRTSLEYRFAVYSQNKWVEVTYRGLVPDTFKDCAEVVVKGKLVSPTRFEATEITAKCPSKYQESQRLTGCGEHFRSAVLAARTTGNKS
jgi:cytochrome c-type biogenesis protein CcmE